MKRFWKWALIVLGVLVLIAVSFAVALFFLRGGINAGPRLGGFAGRSRMFGGMMASMGIFMFFRALFGLGILVLAGFGVAYFVKGYHKHAVNSQAVLPVCANCGKPLAAEWVSCPYCGEKIKTPEEAQLSEENKPQV